MFMFKTLVNIRLTESSMELIKKIGSGLEKKKFTENNNTSDDSLLIVGVIVSKSYSTCKCALNNSYAMNNLISAQNNGTTIKMCNKFPQDLQAKPYI